MTSDHDPARPTTHGWSPVPAPGTAPTTAEVTTRDKDGRPWRIGTDADVAWITRSTVPGLTIASGIPLAFQAYATVVVPGFGEGLDEHEQRVVRLLAGHSTDRDWWLGYLETGASDTVFPDAPRVRMYSDWSYVLVMAGPEQALRWRAEPSPLHCGLPDLMFPAGRSWLISALWDDDWWCLGGPEELIDAFVREPGLEARRVDPHEDATPPGHIAR